MGGGLDLLIVGIAGENLDYIAPKNKLSQLFEEDDPSKFDFHYDAQHALVNDPTASNPAISLYEGECGPGAVVGSGIGYLIFGGNNNGLPEKLNERVFSRIPELIDLFKSEMKRHSLSVSEKDVGVYAINVYDT
jgi:hypothetical protein